MLSFTLDPINREEALRYMGWRGAPDAAMTAILDISEAQLCEAAQPKVVYRVLPLRREIGTLAAGTLPLDGKEIADLLEGCDRILLFAATLSGQVDRLISRAEVTDLSQAFAIDALASAAIEQVCNRAEEAFRTQLPDCYMTWRFSPGYGDFPLAIQPQVLQILDATKHLGLTVTPESILIPRKSVTAVIGLSDAPLAKRRRGCATCGIRESCTFRKNGTRCSN